MQEKREKYVRKTRQMSHFLWVIGASAVVLLYIMGVTFFHAMRYRMDRESLLSAMAIHEYYGTRYESLLKGSLRERLEKKKNQFSASKKDSFPSSDNNPYVR